MIISFLNLHQGRVVASRYAAQGSGGVTTGGLIWF
jgi:hypothetical protein